MIRFDRGAEPPVLTEIRTKQLEKLREIVRQEGRDPRSAEITGYGHQDIRRALYEAQAEKCCYCENEIEQEREDIEHFRPKAAADRRPGSAARHGYWWLSFTWENLLYACRQCNQAAKMTQFPLAEGSTALVAEEATQGGEKPLLIDPSVENGAAHIKFEREQRGERRFWIPKPREGSSRGHWTIRVCGLDRDGLLDKYRNHVEHYVMPYVDQVRDAIRREDARHVRYAMERARRALLNPRQRFIGLSYDALVFFTAERLDRWDLRWSIPG